MKTLTVIDTFGFFFRSYYALPNLRNSKGFPTGLLVGFSNFIYAIKEEHDTDYLLFALDSKGKNFRHEIDPQYKANRIAAPEDLQKQLPVAISWISKMGFKCYEEEGFEADDVIASAVRFAKENEPELWAKQQHMIEEIQRIRAENRYEQYRLFYETELKNRKEIEELSKQAETPRTRQQWYAQEKLLFLQQNILQTLLKDPQTTEPMTLIQHDLQRYIDLLNTESFDRLEKLGYLRDLGQNLEGSVIQIAPIDEELAFIQRQVIERVPLKMREKAVTSEKVRNHDQDNDFSPGF